MLKKLKPTVLVTILLLTTIVIGLGFYNYNLSRQLKQALVETEDSRSTITNLNNKLVEADESLEKQKISIEDLKNKIQELDDELQDESSRLNPIKEALNTVAEDVATQRKLASIDKELLQKYSNVYFLNENYVPKSLDTIPTEYSLKPEKFQSQALPFLKELLEQADEDEISLLVASAYRSFNRQAQLKNSYLQTYGTGANQFSADQGYSEHQLGTTVDFTSQEINNTLTGFENTKAYQWLQNNASEYGFVMSYPPDNQYYEYEPWHWRFVGTDLADDLADNGEYLYDMDERELQKYRLELFD